MKKIRIKKIISIIIELLIIISCYFIVNLNKDFNVILGRKIINNYKTLNKYFNYKYVTLDLTNAKESRFSISDDNKVKSNIYLVTFEDKTILVELNKSTVLTNKVDVMKENDTSNTKMLKEDLNNDSEEDINFVYGYYTNINLNENENVIKYKLFSIYIVCAVCSLMIMFDFLKIINPKFFSKNKKEYFL